MSATALVVARLILLLIQTYCDCRAEYELHEGLAAYERERAAAGALNRLLALFEL